jgi:hypothetical protein
LAGDDDRVRRGQGLQSGGEVGRLADDRLFLHRALADQVADHHQPGGRCRRGLRASFVYYARHVEKNSSLSNWIDGFLATAAREWLATRKGDE